MTTYVQADDLTDMSISDIIAQTDIDHNRRVCFRVGSLREYAATQAAEIARLRSALSDAMPLVHRSTHDNHSVSPSWANCGNSLCVRAVALLNPPVAAPATAPETPVLEPKYAARMVAQAEKKGR